MKNRAPRGASCSEYAAGSQQVVGKNFCFPLYTSYVGGNRQFFPLCCLLATSTSPSFVGGKEMALEFGLRSAISAEDRDSSHIERLHKPTETSGSNPISVEVI